MEATPGSVVTEASEKQSNRPANGRLDYRIFEATSDGFVALGSDWQILFANRVAKAMGDKPLEGIIWDAYPELRGSQAEIEFQSAREEQRQVQFEYFHEATSLWLEVRAIPSSEGIFVFFRDISHDRQRRTELEKTGRLFREFADTVPQIAWSAHADGQVEFLNARWYEYTGLAPTMPLELQSRLAIHPDDLNRLTGETGRAVAQKQPLESEIRVRRHDGEYRWHLLRIVPSKDAKGAVIRWFGASTDIHDQRMLREALTQSERRFQVAMSGGPLTAYEQDGDLRYTWLYPLTEQYARHAIGHRDDEILGSEAAKELTALKEGVLRSGKSSRATIRLSLDDRIRDFDIMVEPMRDPTGKVVGITGAALDFTDQRQAEIALEASKLQLRSAIEQSPIAKVIHAENGEILVASRAWQDVTEYDIAETPTVAKWIGLVGAKAPNLAALFAAPFIDGSHEDSREVVIRTKSGHEMIWIITSAPLGVLSDGRRIAITAGIDITERKWTEEGQRFLNRASQALAASLDDELTLAAIAGLAVPVLGDWCGIDMLLESGEVKLIALVHADPDRAAWGRELQDRYPVDLTAQTGAGKVLRTGESELISEVTKGMIDAADLNEELIDAIRRIELASMIIVPLAARGRTLGAITFVSSIPGRYQERDLAIFEELGRIAGLAVENAQLYRSIQDELQERTRVEEAIRTLNESLNERVRERTSELEAANREMEGFTYSVSHDLRAPLRAVMATSMILLEETGPNLSAPERELLRRQAAAAKKLGVLIDELLKLSRLSRQDMQIDDLDLTLLAEDIVADLDAEGRTDGFTFAIQPGLHGRGDARLVRFVLLNLVENAVKFSPRGGRVEVGEERGAIFVRDEGIGFAMDYAHKLFLPFERLVNDTEYPGTGIGLANVERIVHRHGGRVWAESQPGQGASFFFTLP